MSSGAQSSFDCIVGPNFEHPDVSQWFYLIMFSIFDLKHTTLDESLKFFPLGLQNLCGRNFIKFASTPPRSDSVM